MAGRLWIGSVRYSTATMAAMMPMTARMMTPIHFMFIERIQSRWLTAVGNLLQDESSTVGNRWPSGWEAGGVPSASAERLGGQGGQCSPGGLVPAELRDELEGGGGQPLAEHLVGEDRETGRA